MNLEHIDLVGLFGPAKEAQIGRGGITVEAVPVILPVTFSLYEDGAVFAPRQAPAGRCLTDADPDVATDVF